MAVLVETPIMVDKVAWEQGALVGPASGYHISAPLQVGRRNSTRVDEGRKG